MVLSPAENVTALAPITRGIKSITIPDGVNVVPVIGTITILGGVFPCIATCER